MRLFLICLFLSCASAVFANGDPCDRDAPCAVAGGDYHLILPPEWDGASEIPVLVFFHGHNSSAASVFRAGQLRATFGEAGYAIVAPNGAVFPGRKVRGWPGREGNPGRDDVDFIRAVLQDVKTRISVADSRVYTAGFSAGGSMVWLLACRMPEEFAGFASVAGALRRPNPRDCPAEPVRMLQIHGFGDGQVPFEGRGIREWHQGDLFESLMQARNANQCRSNPDRIEIGERYRCRTWDESCAGGALRFCEHDGGHGLPRGWSGLALDWFEAGLKP